MKLKLLKLLFGMLLVFILIGYNYIINLPQSLQQQIIELHKLPITHFNLLYSLQTLPIMFLIIPLGILYDTFGPKMLIMASSLLVLGQFLFYVYTPLNTKLSFIAMIIGRVLQGLGAEVLYLGQGSLATKWMGNLVGLIVVLPEVGEIGNVFLTPYLFLIGGFKLALGIGLIICVLSLISSIFLCILDKKYEKEYKLQPEKLESEEFKCSDIYHFGSIFWVLIFICTINQSIYIPFMDNANQMIQLRFRIQYENTGWYLCIPFISAMISTLVYSYLLQVFSKKKLVIFSGILGILSHFLIYTLPNCQNDTEKSPLLVGLSFTIFGAGLGSYYALIYPLVGLSVKKNQRGTAYAIVAFVQAFGMSIIPELSALIIQTNEIKSIGYKNSSLLFISLGILGLLLCILLSTMNTVIMSHTGNFEEQQLVLDSDVRNIQTKTSDQKIGISIQNTKQLEMLQTSLKSLTKSQQKN